MDQQFLSNVWSIRGKRVSISICLAEISDTFLCVNVNAIYFENRVGGVDVEIDFGFGQVGVSVCVVGVVVGGDGERDPMT